MSEQYTPRENIRDYMVTDDEGEMFLLEKPVKWGEGQNSIKLGGLKAVNIRLLCKAIAQEQGLNVDNISYYEMEQICEVVLRLAEAGEEVF